MISLFVRSYVKDFKWLVYSVRSMRKNLIGVDEKVLVVPKGQKPYREIQEYFDKIIYVPELHRDGYISQQLDKIRAHEFVANKYILYSDSDCMYYTSYDARDRITNDKIDLYVTRYSELSGDVTLWQGITANILGQQPEWEYMRCFPIMHLAEVGASIQQRVFEYARTLKDRSLSEFNCMGFQAELEYSSQYRFINTSENPSTNQAKQYWSWGGITPDIKKELQCL